MKKKIIIGVVALISIIGITSLKIEKVENYDDVYKVENLSVETKELNNIKGFKSKKNITKDASGISAIEINIPMGLINISEGATNNIEINAENFGEFINISEKDGTFKINDQFKEVTEAEMLGMTFLGEDSLDNKKIEIKLPIGYKGDIYLNGKFVRLKIDKVNIKKLHVNSNVLDMESDKISVNEVDVSSKVGDIRIVNLEEVPDVDINCDNGFIKVLGDKQKGDINIKSKLGLVNVYIAESNDNIIVSGSGEGTWNNSESKEINISIN